METNLVKAFIHGFITTLIAFVILTLSVSTAIQVFAQLCKEEWQKSQEATAAYSGMRGG